MDDLAREAGVGKGTLYRRFSDRASLCRALLEDDTAHLRDEVEKNFGLAEDAEWLDRLSRLLDGLFDFVAGNASVLAEAQAFEPSGAARYDHPGQAWQRKTISEYLKKAMTNGEIQAVDADQTAVQILAALNPDLVLWQLAGGQDRDLLREQFKRFCQHGFIGQSG